MSTGLQTPSSQNAPNASNAVAAATEDPAQLSCPPFVGVSAVLRRLLLQAEIAAPRLHSASLEGEAGTGKHLFAQTLHRQSPHAELPFRRYDAREWLATEADTAITSGTLYLDRVDLLTTTGQALLLGLIKMLQDESSRLPRILLLVSAHVPLRQLAAQGRFIPDLAFRLSAARFSLPPLRDHREDIAPLTQALIDRICRHYRQPTAVLSPGTLPRLLQHNWPGNVRELASVIESAILDSTSGVIRPADVNLGITSPPTAAVQVIIPTSQPDQPRTPEDLTLDAVIFKHIQMVLNMNRGNKLRTARQLSISRSTLYRLLAGESMSTKSA